MKKKENLYERACAIWVANYLRTPEIADSISRVDFYQEDGLDAEIYGSYARGPEWGLEYHDGDTYRKLDLGGSITPGRFLEECVEILEKLQANRTEES